MTFDQLRIFVAVAEALHMTRAAQALNLTQSAVSAAIATLEDRYGISLFHRIGRRIELTDAGRLFLDDAKAVLKRVAEAEMALNELAGLLRGTLTIHASQTISNYWLPPHLYRFRRLYPKIKLELKIGNTAGVAAAVVEGHADLGFVEGDIEHPMLSRETVDRDELVLVVGRRHPWAKQRKIGPADFLKTSWILREIGSGTRSEFDAALMPLGFNVDRLDVELELPSNEAVRAAVESGAGATVMSRLVVDAGLVSGTLKQVPFRLPKRLFRVLQHVERRPSRAASAFLAAIKENET